jgi:hypothetical protein
MHAEDNHGRLGALRDDALRGFDAAQIGHGDIQNRYVRLGFFRLRNRLPAIRGFGNHGEAGLTLQQKPQAFAHHIVIVS